MTSYQGVNYQIFAKNMTGLIASSTPLGINQGEWPEHTWHHLYMRRICSPACDRLHYRRCCGTPYCHDYTMNSREIDDCHLVCDFKLCPPCYPTLSEDIGHLVSTPLPLLLFKSFLSNPVSGKKQRECKTSLSQSAATGAWSYEISRFPRYIQQNRCCHRYAKTWIYFCSFENWMTWPPFLIHGHRVVPSSIRTLYASELEMLVCCEISACSSYCCVSSLSAA